MEPEPAAHLDEAERTGIPAKRQPARPTNENEDPMAQHSTPALDDQFPLHPQEIRSAALQAAARIATRLAFADTAADVTLSLAERFEDYISTGRTIPWPAALDPRTVTTAPEPAPLTEEQLAAGGEKLMAALGLKASTPRVSGCSCYACTEARRLRARQIGRCDHCDKPFTGGSPDGGRMRYWCDDHRPDEIGGPAYPADVDAPEPTPLPEIDLIDELAAALAKANSETDPSQYRLWRPDAAAALAVVRARIGNFPAATPAEDVYRALFGNVGAAQ